MTERKAGYWLIEQASLIGPEIKITATDFETFSGGGSRCKIALQVPEGDIEWCAYGLVYALAVLSFGDARPRGLSDIEFDKEDEFHVVDYFECLRYEYGQIYFSADYVRGRCMKTHISVKQNGNITIETVNRGDIKRWIDKLRGKKLLNLVGNEQ